MIYGTLTTARAWHEAGRIDEWLQLFLRADGKNLALAEGLLEEDPIHFGLRRIPVSLLEQVQSGAPEYLSRPNDIQYFFEVVERMRAISPTWDMPPLIVEYRRGVFSVNDGRHRLEMLRQTGTAHVWAVLWAPDAQSAAELTAILDRMATPE